MSFPCPCCAYLTMPKLRGSCGICPICLWEDDLEQWDDPDDADGANHVSLNEARENYRRHAVSDLRKAGRQRAPLPEEIPPGSAKQPPQ